MLHRTAITLRPGLVCLALLLLFAASGSGLCAQKQPAKVRVVLSWLDQAQFAGFYMAQEQGYYAKAGLDVEIISGGTDLRPLQALQGGECDFAVMMLAEGLSGRSRGTPLVNVAQLMQTSSLMLVARSDSGIRTPRDLDEKRVSLWFGGLDLAPRALFRRYRIDPVLVPQGQSMELFLRGAVEASSAMWYNEYHTLLASGLNPDELVTLFLRDEGLNFPEDGIYCLRPFLREHPELTQAFVQATLQGWQSAFEQPEKALRLVLARMRADNRAANTAHQRWMLDRMFDMMVPQHDRSGRTRPSGVLSIEDFERVLWVLTEEGYVRKNIRYTDFVKELD